MSEQLNNFCLSRAEGAHFQIMYIIRGWVKMYYGLIDV
jgi:hypothetical protein